MNKLCPSCFIKKPIATEFYWHKARNKPSHECKACHRLRHKGEKPRMHGAAMSEREPCAGCYRFGECQKTAIQCKGFSIWVESGLIVPAFVGMMERQVAA